MSFIARLFWISIFALAVNLGVQELYAETVNCTPITSLPITISTSGLYCLTSDLTTNITSGSAITIDANSVVIDFNNRSLICSNAQPTVVGVKATDARRNIKVFNGTIQGCGIGVHSLADRSVVEDMQLTGLRHIGIKMNGDSNILRHNFIVTISAPSGYNAYGILVQDCSFTRVFENDIVNLNATSYG